jgi:hypothetical protein
LRHICAAVGEPDMIVPIRQGKLRAFCVVLTLSAAVAAVPSGLFAQQSPQQAPAESAPVPQAPSPPASSKPGLFDALNKWIDKSASELKESFDKTGKAAKEATEALSKLPGARVIEARERCAVAANGSPDCVATAEAICKSKGFASGKSLETQATQKCSPRVWLSGRAPAEGECTTETFVIKSVCQ